MNQWKYNDKTFFLNFETRFNPIRCWLANWKNIFLIVVLMTQIRDESIFSKHSKKQSISSSLTVYCPKNLRNFIFSTQECELYFSEKRNGTNRMQWYYEAENKTELNWKKVTRQVTIWWCWAWNRAIGIPTQYDWNTQNSKKVETKKLF